MSEDWRKKKYYNPRVLIETERIIDPEVDAILICLTGPQVEMLRNLTQYLHRRSTFAQDFDKQGYLAPSNDDWTIVSAIVADLEDNLMSDCLNDLIAAINAQTAVLDAMMLCVCNISSFQDDFASRLPDLAGYVDQTLVNYLAPGETEGNPANPPTDVARCELAQAMYYYIYDAFTEDILPFANASADTLTGLIVATSTFSLLGGFLGLPVVLLGYIVSGVVAWAIDGAISSIINWLLAIKDEYICVLYNAYPDYALASQGASALIDDDGTLSYLEKAMLKSLMSSSWHMTWVSQDQQVNGTWDSYMVPGQCDDCVPPDVECTYLEPCVIGDWDSTPPGGLVCTDDTPEIRSGFSLYSAGTAVQPTSTFDVEIDWTATGTGPSQIDFDLISRDTSWQINGQILPALAQGQRRIDTVQLSSPGTIGEILDIQLIQAVYWGKVHKYCLRSV